VTRAGTEAAGLTKQVADLRTANEALQAKLDEAGKHITELNAQAAQNTDANARLKNQLDAALAESAQLKETLAAANQRATELETRAVKAENELAAIPKPRRK
jgi:chromosome segregation ATPase